MLTRNPSQHMQNHAMFYWKVSWESKYFLISCTFPRFQLSGGLVWNALGFLYYMNFLDLWTFCWFYVATNIIDSRHSCALFSEAPLHIHSANLWRFRLGDNGIPWAAAALRFCGYGMRVSRVLIWPAMARDTTLTWKLGRNCHCSHLISVPCLEGCPCVC